MTIALVFWLLVFVFALIGSLRGWAKELLVSFSMVIALFINLLLNKYATGILSTLSTDTLFWVRAGLVGLMAYLGYLAPKVPWVPENRFLREHVQDGLLGFVLGAVNGALVFGSIWYFLHMAGYPFPGLEFARQTAQNPQIVTMMRYMPPVLLGETWLLVVVAVVSVFVIVVFV
ncbi:MAG: hypothetical protein ABSG98_04130 [Anaerolineales bacterium]|jgi:uncharacterized membrane protein required for colicin V production